MSSDSARTVDRMKNGLFYWARKGRLGGEASARGTCRASLIINWRPTEGFARKVRNLPRFAREILGLRRVGVGVGAPQEPLRLQWRHTGSTIETDIRAYGRTNGRAGGWTDERTLIPSYAKYLLKSLMSLLLAGVDIPCANGAAR